MLAEFILSESALSSLVTTGQRHGTRRLDSGGSKFRRYNIYTIRQIRNVTRIQSRQRQLLIGTMDLLNVTINYFLGPGEKM